METHKNTMYEQKYDGESYYWGTRPSISCFDVLKLMPPDRPVRLLDIGAGEGRNAVFFARNGYDVTAFDLAAKGVEKTKQLAGKAHAKINVFQADINKFRLD